MTLPPTLPAYERAARGTLPPDVAAYLFGGAGAESALAANRDAFERLRLVPRAFGALRDPAVTLFGQSYAAPILVAPMGRQRIFHRDGEAATARAAAALGLGYVIPMLASLAFETIRAAAEGAPQLLQLYLGRDRETILRRVRAAEAAGISAIVVTADAPVDGVRDRQVEADFRWPDAEADEPEDVNVRGGGLPPFAPGWDDFAWLRGQTKLPLVVKGVMDASDSIRAHDEGAEAIIVSNHGGRVLDGAAGALDMLPHAVAAVGSRIPVLFDSGIRRGADVAKALRLGATAVLVGRPVACGMAVAGDRGAAHVLRMLVEEFMIADGLSHRELSDTSA